MQTERIGEISLEFRFLYGTQFRFLVRSFVNSHHDSIDRDKSKQQDQQTVFPSFSHSITRSLSLSWSLYLILTKKLFIVWELFTWTIGYRLDCYWFSICETLNVNDQVAICLHPSCFFCFFFFATSISIFLSSFRQIRRIKPQPHHLAIIDVLTDGLNMDGRKP